MDQLAPDEQTAAAELVNLPGNGEEQSTEQRSRGLGEWLSAEASARAVLQLHLDQMEARTRETERLTHGILRSRMWNVLKAGAAYIEQADKALWNVLTWARFGWMSFGEQLLTSREQAIGHIDIPGRILELYADRVKFRGWVVAESGVACAHVFVGLRIGMPANIGLASPGIALQFPKFSTGGASGFAAIVDLSLLSSGRHPVVFYVRTRAGRVVRHRTELDHHAATVRSPQQVRQIISGMMRQSVISVQRPTYNTPEQWLRRPIESVLHQEYTNWELSIADDCSTSVHVRFVLAEYQKRDRRTKVIYRESNGHIAAASNSAAAQRALRDHLARSGACGGSSLVRNTVPIAFDSQFAASLS